ncbi:MAG: thiamine pyrophosphate-dependent enzyme [Verrucomicrobia bacterium]|nr:thiamine pyrophosphate-dependent enzyme [Verrucomicrobiota bacterium]
MPPDRLPEQDSAHHHSLVSDSGLFLQSILPLVTQRDGAGAAKSSVHAIPRTSDDLPLSADRVFEIVAPLCPEDFVLVEESPSNVAELQRRFVTTKPDSFYTFASGGLGWDMPAAVGLALAEKQTARKRPVVAVIGDGSFPARACSRSI